MILTYELIRDIKQKEKSEKLQKLPENFFRDLLEYIMIKKNSTEELAARTLIGSIFELRKKKILTLASLSYLSDRVPDTLEPEEKKLYKDLVIILREYSKSLENRLSEQEINDREVIGETENNLLKSNTEERKESQEEKQRDSQKTQVVFLVEIPELFLPSGERTHFKKGETRELDLGLAKILEEKGFCRIVL